MFCIKQQNYIGDNIHWCTKFIGDNQSLHDLFTINESRARGHNFKLYKSLVQITIHKHFFSIRVINNWSSLPYEIVNAVSLDSFKSKLDNVWEDKIYVF